MTRRSRGRPPGATAESHTQILDAVYELLQERSVRDLTIEAVAKRAGVGKPTIYKWWPTKADLVMAMFQERLDTGRPPPRPPAGPRRFGKPSGRRSGCWSAGSTGCSAECLPS